MNERYSLLYPNEDTKYKTISPIVMHDLGFDNICKMLSEKENEQNIIMNTMAKICSDKEVIRYRLDVFEDILNNPSMREDLMEILGKISFIKDYGGINRDYDDKVTVWDLMHRLEDINDYITCVDSLHECLADKKINSKGLLGLKNYIEEIYSNNGFAELKKDISKLKIDTASLRSITIGINLNDRFEAASVGLISINSKTFTKSNVIGEFCDHLTTKDKISQDNEWNGNYKYQPVENADITEGNNALVRMAKFNAAKANPINVAAGVAAVAADDYAKDIPQHMDRVINHMISQTVKKLKETLKKYVTLTITNMTDLIPELMYYMKWAEYIEKLTANGAVFSKASVLTDENDDYCARARGVYNIKLAALPSEETGNIVTNDFDFDKEHRVYLLTGANRGGKTTITQAIGQLFVLAQGGIYIPGDSFEFIPVDNVYTHFPADEDKSFDLGRLGEECKRFKDMYTDATDKSLILLNETFSTTSFEEGYYIAKDSIRAIMTKGIRTIYNTHMHKLALDVDELNENAANGKAYSMVVRNEGEKRSYKIEIAPPGGKSFAADIAKKYGVTYDMLVNPD